MNLFAGGPTTPVNMQQDALLAVRCQLGEADAFDELVRRFHPALATYARRLTGSDDAAADTVQDIWLKAIRALPRLREPQRLRAWLFGIAHRTLMDRFRQQYAKPEITGIELDDTAAQPADLTAEERSAAVEDALGALPLLERETLTLFYLQELSLLEISQALDVPIGTVKSRLFRARRLLRAAMTTEKD
jgi:RNA polymerase sigma factor (sigma-70 family)